MSGTTASAGVIYASFWRRFGAAALDSLVWIVGTAFLPPQAFESEAAATIVGLVVLSAWFNYFAICEWRFGQTIGKNIVGIRVIPVHTGESLSYNAAALRNLLRIVDLPLWLLGVGYLQMSRSPRRQRLGDRVANTVVVREAEAEQVPVPAPAPPGPSAAELFGDATAALGGVPAPPAGDPDPPLPQQRSDFLSVAAAASDPTAGAANLAAGAAAAAAVPAATWSLGRTLRGLAAGLLLGALLLPLLVVPFDPDFDSVAALLVVQAMLGITLVIVALRVAADPPASPRAALARLGLRRAAPSAIGWAALAYVAYFVIVAVYSLIVSPPEQEDIARDLGIDTGVIGAILAVALIAILAPIAEELFFRGMLYGGLRRRLRPIVAALISGAIFGGLHAATGISAVPPLFVFGVVLALLYEKTGSIVPCIAIHLINNSIALAVAS